MKRVKRMPIQVYIPIISDKQNSCPYDKPFGYIYKITNKLNGHYYIGKHEFHYPWLDKDYKGSGKRLELAYKKYGIENFEITLLEWTDKDNDDLNKLEIYWIDMFGAYKFPFHYNLTEGGDGFTPDEEICKKISQSNTGKIRTPEQKEQARKIAISTNAQKYLPIMCGKDNPMYGVRKYGEDNPNYGNYWSDEKRQELSKTLTGRTMSEETKKLWSLQRKGKQKGNQNPSAKPVVQLTLDSEFIKLYSYMSEAKQFGFNRTGIGRCCTHKQDSYKGYKWMYAEEYQQLNR